MEQTEQFLDRTALKLILAQQRCVNYKSKAVLLNDHAYKAFDAAGLLVGNTLGGASVIRDNDTDFMRYE